MDFLSKALELDRECIYFSERAKCKYEIGDYESAIDDLTYAICLRRDRRYNYYWMAHCKYELKDYKGAIEELNIGHTIISRALSVGLSQAVKEMKSLIINPRKDNFLL